MILLYFTKLLAKKEGVDANACFGNNMFIIFSHSSSKTSTDVRCIFVS